MNIPIKPTVLKRREQPASPKWIEPGHEMYEHPKGELRYLLFPDPTMRVRLEPDHGIEAAVNMVANGYVCRVVVHKVVIVFGHKRSSRVMALADKWIDQYIYAQRDALMLVRYDQIAKYRPFLPERL
jgi:hypothetical protein